MATPPSTVPSWDDNDSRSTAPPQQIQDDGLPEQALLPNSYLNWVLRWLCAWAQLLDTLGIAKFDQEHYTTGLHKEINADDIYTDRGGSTAVKVGGLYDVTAAAGTALTNSTAAAALHTTTMTAGDIQTGTTIHLRGVVAVTAFSSGTLTIQGRLGGLAGALLFGVSAPALSSSLYCVVDLWITCLAAGGSGTISSNALITWDDGTTVTPQTGRDSVSTVDTTGDLDLMITGQWSVASAGNSVRTDAGVSVAAA